jgi:hypothetical protein
MQASVIDAPGFKFQIFWQTRNPDLSFLVSVRGHPTSADYLRWQCSGMEG